MEKLVCDKNETRGGEFIKFKGCNKENWKVDKMFYKMVFYVFYPIQDIFIHCTNNW